MEMTMIIVGLIATFLIALTIFILLLLSWNIPVTLLRYTGNKGRPTLIHTKARKQIKNGVPRLYVKGYKDPIRDYLSENYYPTVRGKWGGLILWEFEDGLLTPAIPKKDVKTLTKEEQEAYKQAKSFFQSQGISFEFDDQLYKDLKLKIVDDVDQEFMLQEQFRLESQYSGGWKDFLNKHAGAFALIIICVILLVIVSKFPEYATACANTAKGIVEQSILDRGVEFATPQG